MSRIVLVGLGYWGIKLARAVSRTSGLELGWIVEPRDDLREGHRREFPGAFLTNTLTEALADESVVAVVIATPASTHRQLVADCLVAGKHVFVEKPLALSERDAADLVYLAREHRRVLMVGHTFLFNQAVLEAGNVIEAGQLGDLQYLNFTRTNFGPVRPDTSVLWDLASHDVAIALWLVGNGPLGVSCVAKHWNSRGLADSATLWIEFPTNVVAHIEVSWLYPERVRKFSIVGSKAMLVVDDTNQATPLTYHSKHLGSDAEVQSASETVAFDFGERLLDFSWTEPLVNELSEFSSAILSGVAPRSSGAFGLSVVSVLEAADKSAKQRGAFVEFNRIE